MSYLALYRKYRPTTFAEVVGQEYVLKVLKNSINNNTISHAYLFSGPRGTGKTTIAKLIAKLVNCEERNDLFPCNSCKSCLAYNEKNNPDIIEIDAASNNGVDEIREIRDKVNLMPSLSKYKVYIIDEVHMLSTGAFNALLKTLEEPPSHVIFILATTEFYEVPETIVSRCQCFDFTKISVKNIVEKLEEIVDKERFKVDLDVLPLIAKYADGGLRDAINMLDKLVCCTSKVTIDDFYEIKGLTKEEDLETITNYLFDLDTKNLFAILDDLDNKGKNMILLGEELLLYLKDLLIKKVSKQINLDLSNDNLYQTIDILNDAITNMKKSAYPKVILEVSFLKTIEKLSKVSLNAIPIRKEDTIVSSIKKEETKEMEEPIAKPLNLIKEKTIYVEDGIVKFEESKEIDDKINKLSVLLEENRKIRINNTFATANKQILEDLKIRWVGISEYLYNKEFSNVVSYLLDGNLKAAGEKHIIVSVSYSSTLENALVNIEKIETLLNIVMKQNYKIAFILDSEWDNLKAKYINDKKTGIEYKLKEEKTINYDIIKENEELKEKSDVVKEAEDLFGNDIVEVK